MLDLKGINVFQKILLFGLDFGFKDAGIKRSRPVLWHTLTA